MLGVIGLRSGNEGNIPFVDVWHFHDGEEFRKIVLDTGEVHFVEDDDVDVIAVSGFINRAEEFGLGEFMGEVVVIA